MKKTSVPKYLRNTCIILCIQFFVGHIWAQTSIKLFEEGSVTKSNPALYTNSKNLAVDKAALSSLLKSWHVLIQDVPLPSVTGIPQSVDLDLTEFTVIGENTRVFSMKNGERISIPLPTVRTFRGTVKGNPNTLAFIAAQPNGSISGFIRFDGLEHFMIEASTSEDKYTS